MWKKLRIALIWCRNVVCMTHFCADQTNIPRNFSYSFSCVFWNFVKIPNQNIHLAQIGSNDGYGLMNGMTSMAWSVIENVPCTVCTISVWNIISNTQWTGQKCFHLGASFWACAMCISCKVFCSFGFESNWKISFPKLLYSQWEFLTTEAHANFENASPETNFKCASL